MFKWYSSRACCGGSAELILVKFLKPRLHRWAHQLLCWRWRHPGWQRRKEKRLLRGSGQGWRDVVVRASQGEWHQTEAQRMSRSQNGGGWGWEVSLGSGTLVWEVPQTRVDGSLGGTKNWGNSVPALGATSALQVGVWSSRIFFQKPPGTEELRVSAGSVQSGSAWEAEDQYKNQKSWSSWSWKQSQEGQRAAK